MRQAEQTATPRRATRRGVCVWPGSTASVAACLCYADLLAEHGDPNRAAMALSDSPHLIGRTTVVLGGNPIGERVRAALRVRLGERVE